mmetsp:Transcript_25272/g.48398  ORF Transcript_25272/g.48398 Transcript_25272/m.48398 type:complete len:221 (-) Transcript_25272:590-1252(-)
MPQTVLAAQGLQQSVLLQALGRAHQLRYNIGSVLLQCQIHEKLSGVRIQEEVDTNEVFLVEVNQNRVRVIAAQGAFTDEANHRSCHFRRLLRRQVLKRSLGQVSVLVERCSIRGGKQKFTVDNALIHRSDKVTCRLLSRASPSQKSGMCSARVLDLVLLGKLISLFQAVSVATPHTLKQYSFKCPGSTQFTILQLLQERQQSGLLRCQSNQLVHDGPWCS